MVFFLYFFLFSFSNFFSKSTDYINLVVVNNEILFFQDRDGPYFPSLKLLHKCKTFTNVLKKNNLI